MTSSCTPAASQGGFALIAALFVLIVLAGIGVFAVRVNVTQQNAADVELAIARAESALHTGIEYAAARLSPANDCGPLPLLPARLNLPTGFTITFNQCIATSFMVDSTNVNVFTVDLTAEQGAYGAPGFVSRRTSVRIVN